MSAARPHCRVCLDPQIKAIDRKLSEGTGSHLVFRWLVQTRTGGGKQRALPRPYAKSTLDRHRRDCLGSERVEVVERAPRVPVPTPSDPGERAKMVEELLYSSLAELSAKDLYALHMRELDLKIATENRMAKEGAATPPPASTVDTGFDEAMARAGGHRPELRVVTKAKRRRAS